MERKSRVYVIGVDQMVLPLTRYFVEEGSTPAIAELIARGSSCMALASFPTYTANNWPVIATGAQTGTHSAFAWFIHMPDGEDVSSLTSLGISAEFIWEAAERQGLKSAVLHYPGSMPSRLERGYVIDGNAGPAFGACPFEIATAEAYTTDRNVESFSLKEVLLKPAAGWKGLPPTGPQPLDTPIPVTAKEPQDNRTWQVVVLGGPNGYDRVIVCRERDVSTRICETRMGEWSEWSTVPFGDRKGTVRFKLTGLSTDGKHLKLYRSQIMPTSRFSDPDEIGRELVEKIGPYQEHVSQMFNVLGIADYETCVEEADYQGQWFAKAALYLTKEKDCDLFFCHWHFLDDVNHFHLAYLDPTWPRYDPAEAPKHWGVVRQAYQAIDHMMATLLEGITEDDYVVMVSDHGCSNVNRIVFMERFLFDRGFLVFKDPDYPKTAFAHGWYDGIDWERTKVWLREGVFSTSFSIFINARSPEDYRAIQRDLIRELRTWVDEKTQQTVAALVLSKRDAELIGLWGDQVGDVIVVFEEGYQTGKKDSPTPLQDNTGLVVSGHGRVVPTDEGQYSTGKALFIIAGPGIKHGYERPADKVGHIKLVDVTPTLCHLLQIQPPAQSQGAIAYDLFEGHNMVYQHPVPTPYYEPTKHYKQWMQNALYDWGLLKEETIPC